MSLEASFARCEFLGKGAFGEVFRAVRQSDQKVFAVKIVRYDTNSAYEIAVKEASTHAQLDHCNVLQFIESSESRGEIRMVLELCSQGSMFDLLTSTKGVDLPLRFSLVAQICAGVHYLHHGWSDKRSIIHRDIKLENILLTQTFCAKISDFGVAIVRPWHAQGRWGIAGVSYSVFVVETPDYMSPELIHGLEYSTKTDVWSLGCVFYETFANCLWRGDGSQGQDEQCFDIDNKLMVLSATERDLTEKLLRSNPHARPSAGELLAQTTIMDHLQSAKINGLKMMYSLKTEDTHANKSPFFVRQTNWNTNSSRIRSPFVTAEETEVFPPVALKFIKIGCP